MNEETKVDKDYKEAFNQGYEVAKELGLKPDMLEGMASGNNRIQAMRDGMIQYANEISQEKDKEIIPPLDLDTFDNDYVNLAPEDKSQDKGRDIDL